MTNKIAIDRRETVAFGDIRRGSIFEQEGMVLIKTTDSQAVNLANGDDYNFGKADRVDDLPVGTEITIEITED